MFYFDLHVGFVFVMWPFKLGALIASWFLDREPGFGIAWVWECINRFASGIHWDWWLRWGPRVWVLQMVLSSCCRCELLDDLFTIDTWGQNLTTKCFPQFHRVVHPDLLAAVTRSTGRMHFPWVLKTQTLSCVWRCWAKVTTRKCALVVGKLITICRFAKRTFFNKNLLFESSFRTCAPLTFGRQLHF